MDREQLRVRRTYLALDTVYRWQLVRVTRTWDAENEEGVAFDILEPDGQHLHQSGSAMPVHRFLESYRPAFEALDDPDALALTQVQVQDAVAEIRRLALRVKDDDAANLEEKLHRAALHACAAGHRDARALAARALATDEISFQRHTW